MASRTWSGAIVGVAFFAAACGVATEGGAPAEPRASVADAGGAEADGPTAGGSEGPASTTDAGTRDAGAAASPGQPRGIFLLGDSRPPSAQEMARPFVDGFTMRTSWTTLERSQGVYDFSSIDQVLAAIPDKKRLTLEIFALDVPDYIKSQAGVQTWTATGIGGTLVTTVVPWTSFAIERYAAFTKALAAHVWQGTALGDPASKLANLDAAIVGLQGVRDLGGTLKTVPGYERVKFADAAVRSLHAMVDAFPHKSPFVGFFGMEDGIAQPRLSDYLLERLKAEFFDGTGSPRLGLFQENLACDTPGAQGALFTERDRTYTMFQALRSWVKPVNGDLSKIEKTDKCMGPAGCVKDTNGDGKADDRSTCTSGPEIGMGFAQATFNTRYFEIYRDDLSNPAFAASLQAYHDALWR